MKKLVLNRVRLRFVPEDHKVTKLMLAHEQPTVFNTLANTNQIENVNMGGIFSDKAEIFCDVVNPTPENIRKVISTITHYGEDQ